MGYTVSESSVRVDIFKPSGKWHTTLSIDMNDVYDEDFVGIALKKCLEKTNWKPAENKDFSNGWFAVCLEPYNRNAFPFIVWLRDNKED